MVDQCHALVASPLEKSPGTALYRLCGHWGQKFCFTCVDCAAPQDKLLARKLLPVLSTMCTLNEKLNLFILEFVVVVEKYNAL